MYQIPSESSEFCRRYYKKHFVYFFSGHSADRRHWSIVCCNA